MNTQEQREGTQQGDSGSRGRRRARKGGWMLVRMGIRRGLRALVRVVGR